MILNDPPKWDTKNPSAIGFNSLSIHLAHSHFPLIPLFYTYIMIKTPLTKSQLQRACRRLSGEFSLDWLNRVENIQARQTENWQEFMEEEFGPCPVYGVASAERWLTTAGELYPEYEYTASDIHAEALTAVQVTARKVFEMVETPFGNLIVEAIDEGRFYRVLNGIGVSEAIADLLRGWEKGDYRMNGGQS